MCPWDDPEVTLSLDGDLEKGWNPSHQQYLSVPSILAWSSPIFAHIKTCSTVCPRKPADMDLTHFFFKRKKFS